MLPHRDRTDSPHLETRIVLLTILGFWLFYFTIVTLRGWVMEFPAQGELGQRRAIVTAIGMAVTCFMWLSMRPFDRRALRVQVGLAVLLAIPASIIVGAANYYFFNVYDPGGLLDIEKAMPPDEFKPTRYMEIVDFALTRYFFFTGWAALYLAMGFANDVRVAERRAAEFAQAAQTAELRALRYQVNPHFLFNTLNSLSALVMKGHRDEAETMIMNLATFYRTSLSGEPSDDVALADEIALQRLYLDIEMVRFPKRLTVRIDIPDDLALTPVPGLIIQPLVENAVKHGVSKTTKPVEIRIRARQLEDGVEIVVEDTGKPAKMAGKSEGQGIGLANVRDRLAARFSRAAELEAGVTAEGGWRARLYLPKEHKDA